MKNLNTVFLWENFGPMHVDRCEAVSAVGNNVIGLELYSKSDTYEWIPESGSNFNKVTLFPKGRPRGLKLLFALIAFRFRNKRSAWFLCHYEWLEIFLFACFLRLIGDKVFTMGCSKFDDWQRNSLKEAAKRMFFLPYKGAIGSGVRSKDYFYFHGFKKNQVAVDYNTLSIKRILKLSNSEAAPKGLNYLDREFTIVARLVEKKNLFMALDAYSEYKKLTNKPRKLNICGSGILEDQLKNRAKELEIDKDILFWGFVQSDSIATILAKSLALILTSKEEQFGNVVIEAQALGLPVLLTDVCGARDQLVRSGVNGFVFEPDNYRGLAYFMNLLSSDYELWEKMSLESNKYALKGDVKVFANAVNFLIEKN